MYSVALVQEVTISSVFVVRDFVKDVFAILCFTHYKFNAFLAFNVLTFFIEHYWVLLPVVYLVIIPNIIVKPRKLV